MRLKKLERAWKKGCFSAIRSVVQVRGGTRRLPDWTSGERRVLVLRPDGIGDAIVSTPLLRGIASISPHFTVDVVGSPGNAPFLHRLDFVRRVFLFDKRKRARLVSLARALRREHYDVVIDPRIIEPSMTGLMLMLATGAASRMGVGERGADGVLTHVVPPVSGHIIEQLAGFGHLFQLDPEALVVPPFVPVREDELTWAERIWSSPGGARSGERLLVNVSAGEAPRVWPAERFVKVVNALRPCTGIDLTVAVVGAPGEWQKVRSIADATGSIPVATSGLGHLTAMVARSDVVFTPDTCVVHIASAFGKSVLGMYLKGTADRWGAFGVHDIRLESGAATLLGLSPERVTAELARMLDGPRPRP